MEDLFLDLDLFNIFFLWQKLIFYSVGFNRCKAFVRGHSKKILLIEIDLYAYVICTNINVKMFQSYLNNCFFHKNGAFLIELRMKMEKTWRLYFELVLPGLEFGSCVFGSGLCRVCPNWKTEDVADDPAECRPKLDPS